MSNFTTLHLFGAARWDNRIDFLIFLPHSSTDSSWMQFARSTFMISRDDIVDTIISDYLYHEADIGMREVAFSCMENLPHIPFSIGILEVNIPRWLCDMNRPFERAMPPILDKEQWKDIYNQASDVVFGIIDRSEFCLQLHSMCSFDPVKKLCFDSDVSVFQIKDFLSYGYSWKPRNCNLLTQDIHRNQVSNIDFDSIITCCFQEKNTTLDSDIAYQLLPDYPATKIMDIIPSSLLEITKWSLATESTTDSINTNDIIFDPEKIIFFGKLIAESIKKFLLK